MHLHVPQTHFNTCQHTANPVSRVLAHTPLQRNCLEANPSHCIIPTKNISWASVVNQWLRRVCVAIQGSEFQSLIW